LGGREELILFLQHLVGYVEPRTAVAELLPLGGVRAPQRGVLRPQASRRVVLLQARELLVDRRLQRAEAVPLTRSLARPDVPGVLLERGEQGFERFREG